MELLATCTLKDDTQVVLTPTAGVPTGRIWLAGLSAEQLAEFSVGGVYTITIAAQE